MFTCPESVLRYLCAQYHVHNIPVGDKYTRDNVESVLNELPTVRNFYAENTRVNMIDFCHDLYMGGGANIHLFTGFVLFHVNPIFQGRS